MPDGKLHSSLFLHRLDHLRESVILETGKSGALRDIRFIRDAEVGEHTLPLQIGKADSFQNFPKALGEVCIVTLEAQTSHACIQLQMDTQGASAPLSLPGIGMGHFQRWHILGHPVLDESFRHLYRGVPQQQNGKGHTMTAQLLRFLHVGDRQIVST